VQLRPQVCRVGVGRGRAGLVVMRWGQWGHPKLCAARNPEKSNSAAWISKRNWKTKKCCVGLRAPVPPRPKPGSLGGQSCSRSTAVGVSSAVSRLSAAPTASLTLPCLALST
jgi:hypothetical protein